MKIFNYKYIYIIIFTILFSGIWTLYHFYKEKELDGFLELQTKEAKYRYDSISLFPKDTSAFIFNYLINTPEVINIFKHANQKDPLKQAKVRKKLYMHLKKTYNDLKESNIAQLHFHLANNDSFLRFHRPDKFGDNLASVRKTVVYVNEYKIPVEGFEEGRIFNGYRYVYPLFDENMNHLGSVEISHSIASFKETYERAFKNIALEIIIDKAIVMKKVFQEESKNYERSSINDAFMHQTSIYLSKDIRQSSMIIREREDVKSSMKKFKNFSIAINNQDNKGVVNFVVVANPITKQNVAYAVSFQKSEFLKYFYEDENTQIFYLFLVSFLVTLVIYFSVRFNRELSRKVYNDTLMNIYNRRFFEAYLAESCKKQKRNKTELSLVMFDIDHFKSINDTYGHDIGDEALRVLGEVVQDHIRQTDVFARWGGEEFMLLLDIDKDNAYRTAENLRLAIQKYTKDNEKIPEFTCSFGVISLNGMHSVDEACKSVDDKLYEAKETGRNKVIV